MMGPLKNQDQLSIWLGLVTVQSLWLVLVYSAVF